MDDKLLQSGCGYIYINVLLNFVTSSVLQALQSVELVANCYDRS